MDGWHMVQGRDRDRVNIFLLGHQTSNIPIKTGQCQLCCFKGWCRSWKVRNRGKGLGAWLEKDCAYIDPNHTTPDLMYPKIA